MQQGDAAAHLRFRHSPAEFRRAVVNNARRSQHGFMSAAEATDGQVEILVHGDGGSRGKPQRSPAFRAPKTIVGISNTSDTPTILAAKREMQGWSMLALEPSALRGADRFHTDPHVGPDGDHLATTLHRLAQNNGNAERVYARAAERLSRLVSIRGLRVDRDDVRQLLSLEVC